MHSVYREIMIDWYSKKTIYANEMHGKHCSGFGTKMQKTKFKICNYQNRKKSDVNSLTTS